jgi:hypothetical protein
MTISEPEPRELAQSMPVEVPEDSAPKDEASPNSGLSPNDNRGSRRTRQRSRSVMGLEKDTHATPVSPNHLRS